MDQTLHSLSTQNQALNALLFLYREVLGKDLDGSIKAIRAKSAKCLPTVLTQREALDVIERLPDTCRLAAQLLYGSGLRLMQCLRLRVGDLILNAALDLTRSRSELVMEKHCCGRQVQATPARDANRGKLPARPQFGEECPDAATRWSLASLLGNAQTPPSRQGGDVYRTNVPPIARFTAHFRPIVVCIIAGRIA